MPVCVFLYAGDNDKAKDSFEAAVAADESNASAHYNLAVVLTTKFNLHGMKYRYL
jgi:Tfp pilus assembly protein PilF